jgi:hypothetical protein
MHNKAASHIFQKPGAKFEMDVTTRADPANSTAGSLQERHVLLGGDPLAAAPITGGVEQARGTPPKIAPSPLGERTKTVIKTATLETS